MSTSSVDSKLLQEMWAGRVPVLFSLASQEVTSMDLPLPSLLLLPRLSYLPLCTEPVRHHFLPSAPAVEDEMWMEEGGTPLRWTIPIGTLLDISTAKQQLKHDAFHSPLPTPPTSSSPSPSPSPSSPPPPSLSHLLPLRDSDLPFHLTVHFQQFPSKRLLRCRSLHTARQHFLHSLKEATHIKLGQVKAIMQAAAKDHTRLWDAVVSQQHDTYATLIAQLSPTPPAPCTLPLRLFLVGFLPDEAVALAAEQAQGQHELADLHYLPVQRPVRVKGGETLLDVLSELFAGGVAGGSVLEGVQALVQGVVVSLATPVEWLYKHCVHPDQFLYVVALKRR